MSNVDNKTQYTNSDIEQYNIYYAEACVNNSIQQNERNNHCS